MQCVCGLYVDGRVPSSEGASLHTGHSAAPEAAECAERAETGRGSSAPVQAESWRAACQEAAAARAEISAAEPTGPPGELPRVSCSGIALL